MNGLEVLAIVSPIAALVGLVVTLIGNARITTEKINAAEKAAIQAAEKKIADMHGEFAAERAKHDQQVEALHSRINDVRDSFVRRDDFAAFAGRIDKTLETIASSQQTLQQTLVNALAAVGKAKT